MPRGTKTKLQLKSLNKVKQKAKFKSNEKKKLKSETEFQTGGSTGAECWVATWGKGDQDGVKGWETTRGGTKIISRHTNDRTRNRWSEEGQGQLSR